MSQMLLSAVHIRRRRRRRSAHTRDRRTRRGGAEFFSPLLSLWKPEFGYRRKICDEFENTPYIETFEKNGYSLSDPVVYFMGIDDDDPCFYQTQEMQHYCPRKLLHLLKDDSVELPDKIMAWVDDRNSSESKWLSRSCLQITSPRELYQHLKRNRFGVVGEPDSERRLVYIENIDSLSIAALVLTAPGFQARVLSRFLWKHLSCQTTISINVPPDGLTFQMEFHLPFFAWKRSQVLKEDCRRRRNGKVLRRSKKLNFFLPSNMAPAASETSNDYLYEIQLSCLVTGRDDFRWTAYLFTDTFFKDLAQEDDIDEEEERGAEFCTDPLTAGKHGANEPFWKPREYFIRVLHSWMEPLVAEWVTIAYYAEQRVAEYQEISDLPSGDHSSLTAAKERSKEVKKRCRWMNENSNLLTELISHLNKTINAWDTLYQEDLGFFFDHNSNAADKMIQQQLLHNIKTRFDELRRLQENLNQLKNTCENYGLQLNRDLSAESLNAVIIQQYAAFDVRFPTVISALFLPIIVSAQIFSMNSGVIPIQLKWWHFAISTALFLILVWGPWRMQVMQQKGTYYSHWSYTLASWCRSRRTGREECHNTEYQMERFGTDSCPNSDNPWV
ncbi:hypothetical protein BGW36DRAFT_385370 [Talaromyces proteolyticus]|uniref:Uncharacterized protein n=1 Tax=Talaromyces proteolyticus TaxID=1131652 RepID=A0AAD4KK50_9EURO|nr:uncharacterized protein BGW36DRAFT_385370 [Talaromyces proteolyticus]KAH8692863.1 hypothetical protein BGW36DRAFT_385370 [Talaromyces proteolyticus]